MLRLSGLHKQFRQTVAVDHCDLAVQPGEFVALLGPSGCGKTTMLRLIAGFEQPDAGTIELDGQTIVSPTAFEPPERRRIGGEGRARRAVRAEKVDGGRLLREGGRSGAAEQEGERHQATEAVRHGLSPAIGAAKTAAEGAHLPGRGERELSGSPATGHGRADRRRKARNYGRGAGPGLRFANSFPKPPVARQSGPSGAGNLALSVLEPTPGTWLGSGRENRLRNILR